MSPRSDSAASRMLTGVMHPLCGAEDLGTKLAARAKAEIGDLADRGQARPGSGASMLVFGMAAVRTANLRLRFFVARRDWYCHRLSYSCRRNAGHAGCPAQTANSTFTYKSGDPRRVPAPFQRQLRGVSTPTTNIPYFSFGFGCGEFFSI